MAHDAHLKRNALELRATGMALDDIVPRLTLLRTTVYGRISHLSIDRTLKQTLAQQRGSLANKEKAARAREEAYHQGMLEAPSLLQEQKLRDFVVLYMAGVIERIAATSRFVILTLKSCDFRTSWAQLIEIESDKIRFMRKSDSGELSGRTWRSEWGIFTIRTGDTLFRSRLQAWMDTVSQSWHTV